MDLVDVLLEVLERDASDLHLTAGSPPIIRVNGVLERLDYPRLSANDTRELIYSILSQDQRQRLENEWEIDFSYSVPARARFRVNAFFQRNSLGAAFRLIPINILKLEDLGLPKTLHDLTRKPRGFVVITGPTGSGKSTTLAAMIDEINETREEHIMTIEDPIEFLHRHKKCMVNQREVGADTKGFNRALKSVLRQDPDIILVGEMRDTETVATALTAAETGHLVFATLHTQDAPQTIDRIIDVFPPHQQEQIRVQLSTTLMGVCTQQLLPTRDGRGRVVACEILIPTPAVRNLIREGKTHQIYSAMQTGSSFGMQTMDAAARRPGAPRPHHPRSRDESLERSRWSGPAHRAARGRREVGEVMNTFTYKALDARGAAAGGQIDGDSKVAVAAALRNRGLTVLDLNEAKKSLLQIELGGRVKPKDLTVFSRQFATMVNSGLSMLRCLYVLEEQTENKKLAKVVGAVRADVEAGIALSDALEKHPKVFNRLYVSMVRAGELGGILDTVLNRLAAQLEKEDSIRRAVKSAMVYPIVIGVFAILVLIGMVLFLIPIFAGMYKDLGDAKLPLLTRIMVGFSEILRSWWGAVVLAGVILLVWAFLRLKRTDKGIMVWDRLKLRFPMGVGQIVRKLAIARFSRTLGTLISSGVPILQALEITGQAAGNAVIEKAMIDVQKSVKEGEAITTPLEKVTVFPAMVTQMIAVGEETGSLDSMLDKIADFYEDEVNASIKSLTSVIEPILMLCVGAIVGVVVISMYLPIFNMMNIVK